MDFLRAHRSGRGWGVDRDRAAPKPCKVPAAEIMVVEVGGYAYLVPFVEEDDHFFLKTIIPSRRATRDFIAKESDDV